MCSSRLSCYWNTTLHFGSRDICAAQGSTRTQPTSLKWPTSVCNPRTLDLARQDVPDSLSTLQTADSSTDLCSNPTMLSEVAMVRHTNDWHIVGRQVRLPSCGRPRWPAETPQLSGHWLHAAAAAPARARPSAAPAPHPHS